MVVGREAAGSLIDDDKDHELGDLWVIVVWVLVAMLAEAANTWVACTLYPCMVSEY